VAYKPGISDDRESPSYEIMDLLRAKGAEVEYYDPYVMRIGPDNDHWSGRHSIPWSDHELKTFDAAVVCTPHHGVKYRELADCIPLIVDTCHVVPRDNHAKVVAA
jgi:UDP-N-acetyl-D-glucosamine dehydrogenase